MGINTKQYQKILTELDGKATLVAVSKIQSEEAIQALYNLGHRDFGENYVQELIHKHEQLPKDINWHFIGHLQSNKVKYIAPFVHLIHGVDSFNLLKEINKQAAKNNRTIDCLLQIHISKEETKFGLDEKELQELMSNPVINQLTNVRITGLMGMASFTEDNGLIKKEFATLKSIYNNYPQFSILSMGMSADYAFAIEAGSNMVRIGSLLFGSRIYNK
ncbi:MAG: YggS family pyridoxal phosphate-dependent enzyme [Ferruginibacter sp.]